ncbi:MAG: hypothetical protein HZC29_01745, partial [Thaumarchaeota archaeon]|nr:hypothetical protein [Nitrososphaerota archaeon]
MGKKFQIVSTEKLGSNSTGARPTSNPRKQFWYTIKKYQTPKEIAKAELDITTFFEKINTPIFENRDHSIITKMVRDAKQKISKKTRRQQIREEQ